MYKRLHHISSKDLYQFITFRTFDSIDLYLKKLEDSEFDIKIKQYKIDRYLDSSLNGNYLNGKIIAIVKSYLINLDKSLCNIISFCIMPNHLHIILVQKEELSKIINKIKGGLAFIINKELNKKGKFWSSGYFDKVIRDEKHLDVVYKYIKNNPIKANLEDNDDRFYSIYE